MSDVHQVIGTLRRPNRISHLLENTDIGGDVEFDLIAGFFLIEFDQPLESVEPGRLVYQHGDRQHLLSAVGTEGTERQNPCGRQGNNETRQPLQQEIADG